MTEISLKYQELVSRLENVKRTEALRLLLTALLNFVAIICTISLIAAIIEIIAQGNTTFRTSLVAICLVLISASFSLLFYKPILRIFGIKFTPTIEQIALRIGDKYPDIKDNLCNAVQLISNTNESSNDLAFSAFEDVNTKVRDKDFSVIIEKQELKKSLVFFLFALVVSMASFGFSNNMTSAFYRLSHFNQSFIPPAPFQLFVYPKMQKSLRGEQVVIYVKAIGKAPEYINLNLKELNQEKYDSYKLRLDTSNTYVYVISSIKNSIEFYAETNWLSEKVNSDNGKITVSDKPMVRSISGTLVYPSYTHQASRKIDDQSADITALMGSNVSLEITSNKEIDSAYIVFEDLNASDSIQNVNQSKQIISTNGKTGKVNFRITKNASYYFQIIDKDGLTSQSPIKYQINTLLDGNPAISFIEPTANAQVNENAILPLKVSIADDYGFKVLKLNYKLSKSQYTSPDKEFKSKEIAINLNELNQDISYVWDLKELGISPEDEFEFYLEIFDNDNVTGPKSAKTQILTVRLPSLDEVMKQADNTQKDVQQDLQKVVEQAKELKKDIEELQKELKKDALKNKVDWDDKKKAENIQKKQEDLKKKVEETQSKLSDMTKKLEENQMLSPETLQKYAEMQKLLNEVKNSDMMKMQQKMSEQLDKMTPQEMQKAMENFKMNDEQFRKGIERSMKMLEKMKIEQKTDAITKKAEELAKDQKELSEKTKNSNPKDEKSQKDLAKAQDKLQKELDKLENDLQGLEKDMKKQDEKNPLGKEMDKAKQELNKEQTQKEMQDAEDNIEKGENDKAEENQKNAEKNLKKLAQQMKQMKKKMKQDNKKEVAKKLQKAMSDLVEISKQQEQLKNQTQSSDNNSTQLPEINRKQGQLEDALENVAKKMSEIAEKSFAVTPQMGKELGDAMQQMQNATGELSERRTQPAGQDMAQSMSSLNKALGQMQDAMSQMQGSGKKKGGKKPGGDSGGGESGEDGEDGEGEGEGQSGEGGSGRNGQSFQQRLQQAAAEQQMIQQSLQKMMQGGGKEGQMSQEQRAEMGKLTDKQGKAQKSIDEMAKEQKQFTNADKKKSDELAKIAEEMKEVLKDIQSGKVSEETKKKQEKILSRLLDASKSENERDYETKREAKEGKNYNPANPFSKYDEMRKGEAMQDFLKSLKLSYSKDYEELIRKYFEAMKK
jgi:hypothetical protein